MSSKEENDKTEELYISPLREASITLHVMYEELRTAGFSRKEAMFLVSEAMKYSLFRGSND
mgnify:CR=1 FL=1|jgi:hypothetical protein